MTAMYPIVGADNRCVGFLFRRRPRGGIEAYGRDARPLGVFTTEEAAAKAVLEAAEAERSAG
jgi:hypothetical protein